MRAAVLGYHTIGCVGFDALLRHGFEVAAVVTHRDDPREDVWWESLAERAEARGVPVAYSDDPRVPAYSETLRAARPDVLFSFYFRHMIPVELLSIARAGAFNLHGSLLPKFRGRAPVNWVLVEGETETGVSLHRMVAKPDAGDLVDQEAVAIDPWDTAYTLFRKLEGAARIVLDRALPAIAEGRAASRPLDLARGSYRGGRRPADGRIDWSRPAGRIHDLVRAVTRPYPGAFTTFRGRKLLVWWVEPLPQARAAGGAEPGTVVGLEPSGILVAAGEGLVRLITVQIEGQPQQPARPFAAIEDVREGERLGAPEGTP